MCSTTHCVLILMLGGIILDLCEIRQSHNVCQLPTYQRLKTKWFSVRESVKYQMPHKWNLRVNARTRPIHLLRWQYLQDIRAYISHQNSLHITPKTFLQLQSILQFDSIQYRIASSFCKCSLIYLFLCGFYVLLRPSNLLWLKYS